MSLSEKGNSQPMLGTYCAWCGLPAVESIVVEPAEFRSVKGVKTQVHVEKRADVCAQHATAERQEAPPKEVAAARRSAERKKWKAAQESLL